MGRHHGSEKKKRSEEEGPKRNRFRGATWESNLIVGTVLCIAGATGKITLVGTDSSMALLVVGAGLILWGAGQWWGRRRRQR